MLSIAGRAAVRRVVRACRRTVFVGGILIVGFGAAGPASAYIGDSSINIPDQPGHWRGAAYRRWIRAEASEWHSMRRNADGLYDPASGEYNGLSMAFEVDTVPAFITPLSPEALAASRAGNAKPGGR